MGSRERVASGDPRNAAVLAYLAGLERLPGYVASAAPAGVDTWQLGAHPDLVELLWQTLDGALPTRCAWVVHGRAALVRRSSGIVFGLALGTQGVALRVPAARRAALGPGSAPNPAPAALGPDWVLAPFGAVGARLALAAFEDAA